MPPYINIPTLRLYTQYRVSVKCLEEIFLSFFLLLLTLLLIPFLLFAVPPLLFLLGVFYYVVSSFPRRNQHKMPQYRIPVEMLEEVFKHIPPSFEVGDWHGYPPMLVCKHWYNVVEGSTYLWSDISMEVPQWGQTATPKLLKFWIRKSGSNRGLHIKVAFPSKWQPYPKDPNYLANSSASLAIVLAHAQRLQTFRITAFTHQHAQLILRALQLAKRVEGLDIYIPLSTFVPYVSRDYELGMPFDYSADAPTGCLAKLQSLTIRGWSTAYYHPTFAPFCGIGITCLTLAKINRISPYSFAALCQDLPHLEALTFEDVSFRGSGSPIGPQPETLDAMSWGKNLEEKIVLPRLKTMTIRQSGYLSTQFDIPHVILNCGPNICTFAMELLPYSWCHNMLAFALENISAGIELLVIDCKMPVKIWKQPSPLDAKEASRIANGLRCLKSLRTFQVRATPSLEGEEVAFEIRQTVETMAVIAKRGNDPRSKFSLPLLDVDVVGIRL
jgi:hypothetical protein